MISRQKIIMLLITWLLLLAAVPAFALHPESRIPDKVYVNHQSCKILLETAAKYKIEGVFTKEFEEGKQCLYRIELAASLHLILEKLAEKVVKDGAESVSREDLDRLNGIEEDLRSEMLLVHTRSFQARNEGMGTRLYPLTKNISLSGSLTGAFQNTASKGAHKNGGDAVGRGDLVFNFRITDSTIAIINLRASGGAGIDSRVESLGGLNGLATDDGDNVRFNKAFVEHTLFDDRLIATIGKISITDYFDNNAIANDESSQFLAVPFINAPAVFFPANGPGMRIHAKLGEIFTFGAGYGSSSATGDNITSNGFGIAELDSRVKIGELEGNYRFYCAVDGAKPDGDMKLAAKNAYNAGISVDQQLTDKLSIFGRYAQREKHVYLTYRSWSAGLQYTGLIPGRSEDAFAVAYGQISGSRTNLPTGEKLVETFYSIKLHDKINIVPIFQYLIDPLGNRDAKDVAVIGIRSQVSF